MMFPNKMAVPSARERNRRSQRMVHIVFVDQVPLEKWLNVTSAKNGTAQSFLANLRYHMKCLKINKKKFDQNEGWDCPICDWRKEIPRSSTRPSLPELKDWVQAAETLPFRPDEL